MSRKISAKAKNRGSPSREILYSEAAKHAPRAIEVLAELLDHKNENVRVAAAKAILSKAIPDLKATEISGDLQPKTVVLIDATKGFKPPVDKAGPGVQLEEKKIKVIG